MAAAVADLLRLCVACGGPSAEGASGGSSCDTYCEPNAEPGSATATTLAAGPQWIGERAGGASQSPAGEGATAPSPGDTLMGLAFAMAALCPAETRRLLDAGLPLQQPGAVAAAEGATGWSSSSSLVEQQVAGAVVEHCDLLETLASVRGTT